MRPAPASSSRTFAPFAPSRPLPSRNDPRNVGMPPFYVAMIPDVITHATFSGRARARPLLDSHLAHRCAAPPALRLIPGSARTSLVIAPCPVARLLRIRLLEDRDYAPGSPEPNSRRIARHSSRLLCRLGTQSAAV